MDLSPASAGMANATHHPTPAHPPNIPSGMGTETHWQTGVEEADSAYSCHPRFPSREHLTSSRWGGAAWPRQSQVVAPPFVTAGQHLLLWQAMRKSSSGLGNMTVMSLAFRHDVCKSCAENWGDSRLSYRNTHNYDCTQSRRQQFDLVHLRTGS
jgi:hypothetical protein